MSLSIHIPQFEGPMGLLLYLIRKEEMDIFDIDVHLITSQYLDYIKKMKQFDLEVAGDFIAMAATLIQIKSRLLLPNYNEEGDEDEITEDPRKELVQKLVEYQRFQEAAKKLYQRPLLGRDVFRRGKVESLHTDEEGDILLDEGGLFSLIALYRNSIRKMKKAVHRVAHKTRSIAGRILEIKDKLVVGKRVVMHDLLNQIEDLKSELLITFLSCLELGKMGYVSVYQSEVYGDIYLTTLKPIERDVVGRVEEYDSQAPAATAEAIMETAEADALMDANDSQEESVKGTEQQSLFQEAQPSEDDNLVASDDDIAQAELELDISTQEEDEDKGGAHELS